MLEQLAWLNQALGSTWFIILVLAIMVLLIAWVVYDAITNLRRRPDDF